MIIFYHVSLKIFTIYKCNCTCFVSAYTLLLIIDKEIRIMFSPAEKTFILNYKTEVNNNGLPNPPHFSGFFGQ